MNDWVFNAIVASLILSLVSAGIVIGYVCGFGHGIKRKKPLDGWKPVGEPEPRPE